jgi:uncharacterized caspase-like protein
MNRLATAVVGFGLLATAVFPDSALAERRVALVIGNSAYKNVSTLPNPTRDAQSIAAKFKSAGYDVVTATDVGIVDFRRALRLFEETASNADVGVVFYAGHGIEVAGINYMIPVDAKLASDRDVDDEAIDLDRFLKSIKESKRLGLVILDACRDNPFVPKMKHQRVSVVRAMDPGRLLVVEPTSQNTLIAYAAKSGAVAEDGTSQHSPYTAALLTHLFEPGLDIRFALGRVRDDVRESTGNRQEPFYTGSLGGTTLALVSPPEKPTAALPDLEGQRRDYELVEKLGNKDAWEVFLRQHPTGFYSDLGRLQYNKLLERGGGDKENAEAKAAEAARQMAQREAERDKAEQEQARKRAEAAEAARQRAEREAERQRAEQESARKRAEAAEAERQRIAADAERKRKEAEEAARQKATREETARAGAEARAAEAARQKAEREAAQQRAEQEVARKRAEAAEAARQKAEQEAARKQAEAAEAERQRLAREAERKRAEEARAAEAARVKAEREAEAARQKELADAALKRGEDQRVAMRSDTGQSKGDIEPQTAQTNEDAVCRREAERLAELQSAKNQSKAREDLKRLAQELICERLRPNVTAALEQMTPKPEPATQPEDEVDRSGRRQRAKRPQPEDRQHAKRPQAEESSKAVARHKDEEPGRRQRGKREESRPQQASRPAPRQALSVPVGHSSGRGGAMVGVGF